MKKSFILFNEGSGCGYRISCFRLSEEDENVRLNDIIFMMTKFDYKWAN